MRIQRSTKKDNEQKVKKCLDPSTSKTLNTIINSNLFSQYNTISSFSQRRMI